MTTDLLHLRGPVRRADRALAPDLARGAMLLLIALANAAGVVFAAAPGVDPTPHGVERLVNLLMFTLVDARAYPVFAFMFGYGLVQLARRQQESGADPRPALVRRNCWLVAFGLGHAVLLYFGDFLGAYGIVGLVVTLLFLRRSDRVHRIVLWLWALSAAQVLYLAISAVVTGQRGSVGVPVQHVDSLAAPDYLSGLLDRLVEWPVHTATVLPIILISWLGVWAARRRILEEPARHRTLLRRTAVLGLAVAVLGGLPQAMLAAGLLTVDAPTAGLLTALYGTSGMFAGPGYVAVFGLLALRFARTGCGPAVRAVRALGQRSLSGYLTQSVAWLVLLAPYTLALGHRFGSPTVVASVVAVLVWLATVVAAAGLDRLGAAGPAELLLRRLTYGARRGD